MIALITGVSESIGVMAADVNEVTGGDVDGLKVVVGMLGTQLRTSRLYTAFKVNGTGTMKSWSLYMSK